MIIDLHPRRSKIGKRIKRKLEVLQEWERSGIPIGSAIPASLSEVRAWSEPSLGIQSIGSPSDFTTTHPEHGHLVQEIWDVLERLRGKYVRLGNAPTASAPAETAEAIQLASLEGKLAEGERRLIQLASQWTMTRNALEREQRRTSAFVKMITRKDQIIAEKNDEIAELQRQLNARRGLRLVE